MAAASGKRPWGEQNFSNVIDLTISDAEDDRPSKRQRSISHINPPWTNGSAELFSKAQGTSSTPPNGPVTLGGFSRPALGTQESSASQLKQVQVHKVPVNGLPKEVSRLSISSSQTGRRHISHGSRSPSVIFISDSEPDLRLCSSRPTSRTKKDPTTPQISHKSVNPIRFDAVARADANDTNDNASTDIFASRAEQIPQNRPQRRPNDTAKENMPTRTQLNTATNSPPASSKPSMPTKPQVFVNVPPTPSKQAADAVAVINRMKQDITFFKEASEIDIKLAGIRPLFDKDPVRERIVQKMKQKKQKTVDTSKMRLDFGKEDSSIFIEKEPGASPTEILNPRQQALLISKERFKAHKDPALSFENRRNARLLNGKFQFVSEYVLTKKVRKKYQTALPARMCECLDCSASCACSRLQVTANTLEVPCERSVQPYYRHPSGKVCLTEEFLNTQGDTRIYECGDCCKCTDTCINRVVQKGRTVPLQVFETAYCGFGVRSSQDILRGQFIDVYLGEVLTTDELAKRENAAEEDSPSYVLSLDVFISDDPSMLHIDGEHFGSVMRFVNHSCEPNCKALPVMLSGATKHIYHVGFFATKDIPKDTELTIDYEPGLTDDSDEPLDADVVSCQCLSQNCRKRLWRPGKEKRGHRRVIPSKDDD